MRIACWSRILAVRPADLRRRTVRRPARPPSLSRHRPARTLTPRFLRPLLLTSLPRRRITCSAVCSRRNLSPSQIRHLQRPTGEYLFKCRPYYRLPLPRGTREIPVTRPHHILPLVTRRVLPRNGYQLHLFLLMVVRKSRSKLPDRQFLPRSFFLPHWASSLC